MFGLGFDFYIPQFSDTVVEKQDSPKVQNLRPAFPPPVAGTVETLCGKVNNITIRSTAKTVKPGIYFHAGVTVCMEWTANHAAAVGLKAIGFCSLSSSNIPFYDFK